jgi:LEA14-like dessication related protein
MNFSSTSQITYNLKNRQFFAYWYSRLQALERSNIRVKEDLENVLRIDKFYRIYD